jgi:hypothetical protein
MRDLYLDDIENKTYSDKMILEDVRALRKAGQREGHRCLITRATCRPRTTGRQRLRRSLTLSVGSLFLVSRGKTINRAG